LARCHVLVIVLYAVGLLVVGIDALASRICGPPDNQDDPDN
jgi:hypothetical protein